MKTMEIWICCSGTVVAASSKNDGELQIKPGSRFDIRSSASGTIYEVQNTTGERYQVHEMAAHDAASKLGSTLRATELVGFEISAFHLLSGPNNLLHGNPPTVV